MKKVPAPQPVIEERDLADLPEGWAQSTLSEICDINPPKPAANSVHEAELVTFVPMPAVDETLGAISKPDLRPFSKVRKGRSEEHTSELQSRFGISYAVF